jgi:alpha-glucosidase
LYRRYHDGQSVLVALNLGAEPVSVASDDFGLDGEILLSTLMDRAGERVGARLDLRGNEGVIVGRANESVV